ncbi:hypothetical protein ACPAVH_33610 [Enterobacteriaceae bacterium TYF_5]
MNGTTPARLRQFFFIDGQRVAGIRPPLNRQRGGLSLPGQATPVWQNLVT